ncbi:MAG: hypothetical protein F2534_05945 [Actinobacteria bacterium]|jgi:hypothetical protein|nr:hypothetical protein [Actinomycetota bacterium]
MPQHHHRRHDPRTDADLDDLDDLEHDGPVTLVDPQAGLPADTDATAVADAVDADADDLAPEEAALHIEREPGT